MSRNTALLLFSLAIAPCFLLAFVPFAIVPLSSRKATRLFVSMKEGKREKVPGSADLGGVPWRDLGFGLRPTKSHVQIVYREHPHGPKGDGSWGEATLISDPYLQLHIGATALHYGQSCLEGMKAFCHGDGTVHVFRPEDHALRFQASCRRILMPELPVQTFLDAIERLVRDNIEYVPPYGSSGALYIRPIMFGSGARIGVQPADEYTFLAMVTPVSSYYPGGLRLPIKGLLMTEYDRAAPRGVGGVKVAGNYAADLLPSANTKQSGYDISLYLDATTQSFIEEFSTSSFVGISSATQKYVTPRSASVLRSITNQSLMKLAEDNEGLIVEKRDIPIDELDSFDEVMAIGTGVVVTPVGSITAMSLASGDPGIYTFGDPDKIGPITQSLYEQIRDIQIGDADDKYGWNHKVDY